MSDYNLSLPDYFDDYERETAVKGWYSEVFLTFEEAVYRLNFYDAFRLKQEIESSFEIGPLFFEPNLLVIETVDRAKIEEAAEFLVRSGKVRCLVPE